MLKLSDKDMSVCMQEGCNLLFMNVPAQCCDKKELYLVMLGLQKIGIPEEEAKLLALKMSKNVAAA
jgi:hypothetical protein